MKRYYKIAILIIVVIVAFVGMMQLITAKEGSSLPPKHSQLESLKNASKYTSAYRQQAGPDAIKGGLFWKDYVQKLLDQSGCVAMRYYHGMNTDGKPVIVLVGVNDKGDDITDGVLLELIPFCPPFCPTQNPLTSDIEVAVGN